MMNYNMSVASVQTRLPQYRSYQSTHSVTAFHDYHSDPLTDRSTDGYLGDSSSLHSTEAARVATLVTPPYRLHISARGGGRDETQSEVVRSEAVQSEATIPVRTIRQIPQSASRSLRMQSEDGRIPNAQELAFRLDGGPPTPNVNDALYLQYALSQITRDRDQSVRTADISSQSYGRSVRTADISSEGSYGMRRVITGTAVSSEESYPVERVITGTAPVSPLEDSDAPDPFQSRRARRQAASRASASSPEGDVRDVPRGSTPAPAEFFVPMPPLLESPRHPNLNFKPAVLRLPFMTLTILFCLFMITIIMFCAIYSTLYHGLTTFSADLDGGLYFVFRFLPQIFGAITILCLQAIMTGATRILPFTMMATTRHDQQSAGLFQDLYSRNFIWPRYDFFLVGYPLIGACYIVFWVINILIIPLLSSLFSVVEHDGRVRWATVQGIAWTCLALYALLLLALSYMAIFFYGRVTGLIWDPTSLADIICLLPRSNSLAKYSGTETSTRLELRTLIGYQRDRLGNWKTDNPVQGIFYGIGEMGRAARPGVGSQQFGAIPYSQRQRPGNFQNFLDHPLTKPLEMERRENREAALYNSSVRYQYLPWFLSDTFILLWPLIGFVLLLALIIVSFLTSTNIRHGFSPDLSATPNGAGFSPAIFLYSFIPSLIGNIMFLLYQSLDMAFRILYPWSALSAPDGSPATNSLLLNYTSNHPLQITLNSHLHSHHRLTLLTLLSTLFILIPILSGGLFFPLIALPSTTLLIFPNLPSFYLLLSLLILYFIALLLPIPERHQMRLPHSVTNLAEVISFFYNSGMLNDAPFRAPRDREDLVARLGGGGVRYAFGWFDGRDGREGLGVDGVGKRGGGVGGGGRGGDILVNREVLVEGRGRGSGGGGVV